MTDTPLFQPYPLGRLTLANRIVMAPLTRNRAGAGLVPGALAATYYAQRASAGLIISEATQVSAHAQGYQDTPGLYTQDQIEGWRQVTDAVHAQGGRIFAQLWHVGRISHVDLLGGAAPVAPSAIRAQTKTFVNNGFADVSEPRALDIDELPGIVDDFRRAAANAIAAGFDGVEIHGANGYLIDQFLRDGANRRTDAYGGSAENRARFPLRVAKALREAWPRTKALGARFNGSDWVEGGVALEEAVAFGQALHGLGYDYLHLSSGGNVPRAPIPGDQPGYQVRFAEAVKQAAPQASVMAVGMIFDPHQAEAIVASGQADLIAVARAVLDDPNWAHHAAVALGQDEGLPPQYERAGKAHWPGYGR